MVGEAADGVGGDLESIVHRRCRSEPELADRRGVAADDDHLAGVLLAVGAPVPGVERVHAVVGVAGSVQVAVPVVLGVLLLPLGRHHGRVGRVGEHLVEEVDVARVVDGMELLVGRVRHDHDAALSDEGLSSVHVEQVPEAHAHHEDRVHDRLGVVRADERDAHREDVGLAFDLDDVLVVHVLEGALVDGLGEPGLHAGGAVG